MKVSKKLFVKTQKRIIIIVEGIKIKILIEKISKKIAERIYKFCGKKSLISSIL